MRRCGEACDRVLEYMVLGAVEVVCGNAGVMSGLKITHPFGSAVRGV